MRQFVRQFMFLWFASAVLCLAMIRESTADEPTGYDLLGKGMNFGNILEAPNEGDWGLRFDDRFPQLIKEAGFDSVRIPVRWSNHQSAASPYTIDAAFLARVQHIVQKSLDANLKVVLNVHHFEEIFHQPDAQRERFFSLWDQISEAFEGADDRLIFELLNEPHDQLDAPKWNSLFEETLARVRKKHPTRWVMVGPHHWNNIHTLPDLKLPESDRRLIVTVHYYLPFAFTHQGASWMDPPLPTGIPWNGTDAEIAALDKDLEFVRKWAVEHRRPIYVGEFGAYEKADTESRVRWMHQVKDLCEAKQFSWAYWELASGFGVLDAKTMQWKQPLLDALR